MVLKSFIHFVINKYLKNYIERLDHEKLKFSLKNGHVLLENLHIKPDALAYLNIPVTVAAGYLEKLRVTIPWKSLHSSPTEIHIEGVYLLIVPKKEMVQDLTEIYAEKMKRVQQKVDNLRKAALEHGKFDDKESLFVERMRLQLMKNLVLTVRNVHISYEMASEAKLGHPFSFGFTLHYLELTTTSNGKSKRRSKGNTVITYRVKEMNSLSIYWNTKCRSRLGMPFKDVLDDLKSKIATDTHIPHDDQMHYILRPVNLLTETLITFRPKEHKYERNTLTCEIDVEQINFHVDSKQVSDMLDFVKFQHYTTLYDRCQEYRQLISQTTFAFAELSDEQKQRVKFLESKLDVFNLAYIRHKVEIEASYYYPALGASSSTDQQHRWNPWAKVKMNVTKVLDYGKTLTTMANPFQNGAQFYFEDTPKIDIEVNVREVHLNLLSPSISRGWNDDAVACVNVNDARVNVKRMCITSRIECQIDLGYIQLDGTERDKEHRATLIRAKPSSSPSVHIEFELFPADQRSDYRLHMMVEPLKVVYDAPTLNRLVSCFESNDAIVWPSLPPLKDRTAMELERDYPYKKIFDVTVHLQSVSIVLPECGVRQADFSMVRVEFSNLILKTCLDDEDESYNEDPLFQKTPGERQFYRKYQLELSDLRMLYTHSNKARLQLLQRTPLIDLYFYKCIYSDDANLAKWRIGAKLAMGEMLLSKTALTRLMSHLKSVPLLHFNLMSIINRINFYFSFFRPHTTLLADLSIYNGSLRMLIDPPTVFRTDAHISISKKRTRETHTVALLNQSTITQHPCLTTRQSSQLISRNERLAMIYSGSVTTLL